MCDVYNTNNDVNNSSDRGPDTPTSATTYSTTTTSTTTTPNTTNDNNNTRNIKASTLAWQTIIYVRAERASLQIFASLNFEGGPGR
jgi:hypothetical protein